MARSRSFRSAVLVAYVAVMLVALLMPVPSSLAPGGQFDKLVHVALFMGLALLVVWSAGPGRPHRIGVALGTAVALAAVIEVLQAVLPYRSGDIVDFAAGAVGAGIGAFLCRWMQSRPAA
ncbi:MAG: VanZ family protein [Gemmatimonadota bacterium]|nr:VanZ family protein [Gemmatimonadota bacterium]MDH4350513.1 VanZ family protein [Gemmatimonadota bacterium]